VKRTKTTQKPLTEVPAPRRLATPCPVCRGKGHLMVKQEQLDAKHAPGVITRGRRRPPHWVVDGFLPMALQQTNNNTTNTWTDSVRIAYDNCEDVVIQESATHENSPRWLPKTAEQMCNLVGSWRILQRVGSHRWTTDDLVTAWVAGKFCTQSTNHYLDLGCGNASVLLMTAWIWKTQGMPSSRTIVGVEARSEAVELAKRSVEFNLGTDGASIIHSDFRDFNSTLQFQLITGTPPYFRVDFDVRDQTTVTSAIINQGGMPTAKQSAPARCEFRGGIEAYCTTAARFLDKQVGHFCVCENWLNHERVLKAAMESNLQIVEQYHVHGKEGRPILFAVYVMQHGDVLKESKTHTLVVRGTNGEWTEQYKTTVLHDMSIPYHADHSLSTTTATREPI
jgi:tRNA1Val (adenine37-N6)-methyltransferase